MFGIIDDATIKNLSVSGNITSTHEKCRIGGFVAYTAGMDSTIEAGYSQSAIIKQCYNTADITGYQSGGIVGYNSDEIENCYNTGKITGETAGGIAGYNRDTITYCYTANNAEIVKSNRSYATVTGCYNDPSGNGWTQASEFENWDFDTVWIMEDGDERPYLRSKHEENGSTEYPYTISTLYELEAFRDKVNGGNNYEGKLIILKADIDMSKKYGKDKESWTPIGTTFKGTFEGNGKTIKNIYAQGNTDQGLFSYIDVGGTIQKRSDCSI